MANPIFLDIRLIKESTMIASRVFAIEGLKRMKIIAPKIVETKVKKRLRPKHH